jgi:hypothetical protein
MRSKVIHELKGVHEISEIGQVINKKTGRVLKTSIGTTGYERVHINISKCRSKNF